MRSCILDIIKQTLIYGLLPVVLTSALTANAHMSVVSKELSTIEEPGAHEEPSAHEELSDSQEISADHYIPYDEFIDEDSSEDDSDPCLELEPVPADDQGCSFEEAFQSLSDHPEHLYPYAYLPSLLADQGQASIKLFVYGSLMDCRSAAQTLCTSALKTRELARAYGVKTIYNRSVPYVFLPHWGVPENPYAIAMLNTAVSQRYEDVALGILLDIPVSSITPLLAREVGYDLKPVVVQSWSEPKGSISHHSGQYKVAYILSSPTPSQYTGAHLLPREGYYQRVMEAAKSNGEHFYKEWLENTYLADGVTTVGYYELYRDKVTNEFDQYDYTACVGL
ncbi:hypothetical protein [uncultured Endozoicomonas sp.]|uniref:hypothetical protein n=1 Tax=uncultured Endozoicomonas sp. TaxID=432652 RepID=UPI00261CDE89|nr:hypothetical protein [uncultured Endozoicomonas sp.]